ncbi:hypothetical protein [Paenalcaligenes suwonensis]|uniref:hypothetical protein n=1 Tax=Paenalcaligenes suwonensis TaxID=1202713 RepID=UPI001407FDF5|nr:hypothetical protein [Paenalcaligenes suwonensis]NHC62901.1 hypothetical protein [Paenalcaligenes suwonensis]
MTESQKERKAIDGLRERILDALAGNTPAVFMAWNHLDPAKSVPAEEIADQVMHDLYKNVPNLDATLLTALFDDGARIRLREEVEKSIGDAAACTVGQMTQQRLDEVAYGCR